MNNTVYLIIGILALAYIVFRKKKETYIDPLLQIKPSSIHGDGVFAIKMYNPGDVILDDIFPDTPPDFDAYKMTRKQFDKYMSLHGKKINHCGSSFNSDLIDRDKKYKLVATNKIKKGEEITANYNRVNKNYPFIAAADESFASC
jgi:signal peptidase I